MDRGARFLQSAADFPCMVNLGRDVPSWGLNRWGGPGLRFVPSDDEGFTQRGNRQRLVYKGRRHSHRFTILGDTAFEYDCILEKEPESNVITLLMEGAEQFDFFRQPDFLKNPLLAGSYAVYKKVTLIGEGTGKLCHIHRPEIIDRRGRRCWGDLSIRGNELRIIIPEAWLSEAEYPVVVDPIIGLATLGALGPEDESEDENSYYGFNDWTGMYLYDNMGVNQFTAPHPISGDCTAHLYVDCAPGMYHWSPGEKEVWPVLYSHDTEKDQPGIIKSSNGGYIDNDVGRPESPPRGWRSTTVTVDGIIQQGQVFWFGFLFWRVEPRYDYGGRLYRCPAWPHQKYYSGLRYKYKQYPIAVGTEDYEDEEGNLIEYVAWVEPSYELKISMYLEYDGPAINYTRTLTQGIRLTDTRKRTGTYKRSATQTVRGTTAITNVESFYRSIVQTAKNTMTLKRYHTLIRNLIQRSSVSDMTGRLVSILRKPIQTAGAASGTQRITQAKRTMVDTGKSGTGISKQQVFKRTLAYTGATEAEALRSVDYVKQFQDTAGSTAHTGVFRNVVFKIAEAVAALYAMKAGAGFNRSVTDTAKNSTVMGGMLMFLRILCSHAGNEDHAARLSTRIRSIQDAGTTGDVLGRTGDYLRGLFIEAGIRTETKHLADYHREALDSADISAVPLRHLFIFIRLVTASYIRDYILRRFLKSREEVVIKSPVCRELNLESRLH
jgi:hypothetical protein